ncbi:glycine betaine/L-proline ABC transporter ATP-binding protein [Corynebacterium sp. MSK297]|uniref:quaternary amine ABC transporter ATP-binding protein n=1 Tax=Corynebacterium sp. MSK297 TaxID=3050221 RepID=UPI00254F8D7D|nr:glycine betaine/L-proline ABC transporter ATP-binding protein [Corynebacterium sp. MSK297]MDK8845058.1 glycine betaine/L-proline ABC transporter ATP-binding protein [Corynebacterium sp. MSK297]
MTGISANGLYKIFGKNPKRGVDALHNGISREQLREDGLTAAVIDASFEVIPGEVFVVMGLSGSGKSTLIRMVNGLHPATAGELRLGGHVITDMSEAELRAVRRDKISMVFQNFALLPHRTVRDNAAYGLEIKGVNKSEREEKARKALQMVGLEGWEHYRPDELSGGMKQRVGLARALANDTDILLMDEAFSALDPLIRKEMQDHLMNLQQELGKTVLFITHDLNEAMRIGDRIAVMRDGRIEQIGTAGEILREPANDYVAQFIRDVDRSRVLLAGDICESLTTPLPDETTVDNEIIVAADIPVSQLFSRAAGHEQPLVVKNSDGGIDGIITKETLLAAVADHSETSEEGGR